jgi:hypothetical protein
MQHFCGVLTYGSLTHNHSLEDLRQAHAAYKHMLSQGWCVHQVDRLAQKYDRATFLYLAKLQRPSIRRGIHERCLQSEHCMAYNTNPTTYKTQHTTAGCACATISVPYVSLLQVIRYGHVPLITIKSKGAGASEQISLHVSARSVLDKYTAISHVWADGLGNPKLNGLPSCQIERLRTSLSTLQQVGKASCFMLCYD